MKNSIHSAEIKTELLLICEAFNLGELNGILSFKESTNVEGYILTEFKTESGDYTHWYRIK